MTGIKRSIVAVLLGQLTDKILFIPLVVLIVTLVGQDGLAFSISTLVVGSSATAVGAYVAARFAGYRLILHGVLVASITWAISFARFVSVQLGDEPASHPLWWEIVSWGLTLGAGFLGGYIAAHQQERKLVERS